MALDEPKDSDQVFDIDGFQYLVNKDFLDKVKPVKVDFIVHGFKLDCGIDFRAEASESCGGCGSSSNCCH
jgi:iron-sulfur cluster assembly protein